MQPRELSIKTPHLTFAALEWGEGSPVIALHGWLDNAASFNPLAARLEGIRLIAVDMAGHGLSEHRPHGFSYDIWHYVEDLFYLAKALELERFSLLGHSMGAVISTLAAGSVLQEQVTALVAIDGLCPRPRAAEASPKALTTYITERTTPAEQLPITRYRSKEQAIRARTLGQFPLSKTSAQLLVERSIMQKNDHWVWRSDPRLKLGSPTRFTLEQSVAFLRQIRCPVHGVFARNGPISEWVERYSEHGLPDHIQFHPLIGTHHLHMDGPVDTVANIVNAACGNSL